MRLTHLTLLALSLATTLGCNSTPAPKPTPAADTTHYPARPTVPPPPFKLFHQTPDGSFTLVTSPTATDDQVAALIYQLRDAAHTRTFDKLNIPQKSVDARDPMVWFHIYKGPKCAPEKYADGKLPCGASYKRFRRLHLRRRPQPPVGRRRPPPRRRPPNRTLEPQRPLHPVIFRLSLFSTLYPLSPEALCSTPS